MRNIRFSLLLLLITQIFTSASAQEYTGAEASAIVSGAKYLKKNPVTGVIEFVRFYPGEEIPVTSLPAWVKSTLGLEEIALTKTDQGNSGWTHYRYDILRKGVRADKVRLSAHVRGGNVVSVKTNYIPAEGPAFALVTADDARATALAFMPGTKYIWQDVWEEMTLKADKGDPTATWYPDGDMVYSITGIGAQHKTMRLAWRFDVYVLEPVAGHKEIYVDATTGEILFVNELMHSVDAPGTAHTMYVGTQSIVADYTGTNYRLREAGRGGGIETWNAERGTSTSGSVDFTDNDNDWNNVNAFLDQTATDVHYGAEMTYDYLMNNHGRNSYNGAGGKIRCYVHWDNNWQNAQWDGTRAKFGDGGGGVSPFTTIDVVAHELGHGVTGTSAGLVYMNEPGALNESFSDLIGISVEHFGAPGIANWMIGDGMGDGPIRSMSDPKSLSQPDTYLGINWFTGTDDNGGVHYNSGVQNHWYFLLVNGGTGTNDNSDAYNISAVGFDTASKIFMRNLITYLDATDEYDDARYYSIQSAIDLYGECSNAMIQCMNAWYAVGVGSAFSASAISDFTAPDTVHCTSPAVVNFKNLSTGALDYKWTFGDGSQSTVVNPTKTYTFPGFYTVTLIANGCGADADTNARVAFISIDPGNPCVVNMTPDNAKATYDACTGRLRDTGGGDDYPSNVKSEVTIAPVGATSVRLDFLSFEYATGGDYIGIYDGPDMTAPLIGLYNGTAMPGGGTIISTGPSITIIERSNGYLNYAGFELNWSCTVDAQDPAAAGSLTVFPNPVNGTYTVDFSFAGRQEIEISMINSLGQTLSVEKHTAYNSLSRSFDASNLEAGIYFVKVVSAGKTFVEKLQVF